MTTGRWWPPFDGVTEPERWRRVLALLGVLAVTGVAMVLIWPESPGDIVAFEKAGDVGAPAFLDAWTGWDGWRVALTLVLDLPFLVAYGLGGALVLDGVVRWSDTTWWSRILRRLVWLPLVAAGFDVLENVALLVVVTDRVDAWPDIARVMANIKFAVLTAFYIALAAALIDAAFSRLRR